VWKEVEDRKTDKARMKETRRKGEEEGNKKTNDR